MATCTSSELHLVQCSPDSVARSVPCGAWSLCRSTVGMLCFNVEPMRFPSQATSFKLERRGEYSVHGI